MKPDDFADIYSHDRWASAKHGTRSGPGSTLETTGELRRWLPRLFSALDITEIVDIPCGEWGFMQRVDLSRVRYVGYDVVPDIVQANRSRFPKVNFRQLDLTQGVPQQSDLLICKDLFQHLSNDQIRKCIANIRASAPRFVLTSCDTYPAPRSNSYRPQHGYISSPVNLSTTSLRPGNELLTARLDHKYFTLWSTDPVCKSVVAASVASMYDDRTDTAPRLVSDAAVLTKGRLVDDQQIGAGFVEPGCPPAPTVDERLVISAANGVRTVREVLAECTRNAARSPERDLRIVIDLATVLGYLRSRSGAPPPGQVERYLKRLGLHLMQHSVKTHSVYRLYIESTREGGWATLERRASSHLIINDINRHYRLSTGCPPGRDIDLSRLDLGD
jgi:hypothetical protein